MTYSKNLSKGVLKSEWWFAIVYLNHFCYLKNCFFKESYWND